METRTMACELATARRGRSLPSDKHEQSEQNMVNTLLVVVIGVFHISEWRAVYSTAMIKFRVANFGLEFGAIFAE